MRMQQNAKSRWKWAILLIVLLNFFLLPSNGFAEGSYYDCIVKKEGCIEEVDADKEGVPTQEKAPSKDETSKVGVTAWEYIKTFLALVFVIGLLYALLKFMNRKNRLYDKNRMMKNLGGLSLGQQKSIQLIVVGETYYLVGVGEDIRLLKEITDEKELASLLAYYDEADDIPFQGPMEKLLSTFSPIKKKVSKKEEQKSENFGQLFNHRLDEIKAERKKQVNRLTEKEHGQDD